jgi:hypothetical protein
MSALVAKNEPRTLSYEFYISADRGEALVHESYADAAAFQAHLENVGHLFGELQQTAEFGETIIAGGPVEAIWARFSGAAGEHPPIFFYAPIEGESAWPGITPQA